MKAKSVVELRQTTTITVTGEELAEALREALVRAGSLPADAAAPRLRVRVEDLPRDLCDVVDAEMTWTRETRTESP